MNRKSVGQTPLGATRVAEPPQHHQHHHPDHTLWRARAIACLRVAFGLVWAVAAWFKWQPAFQQSFLTQMTKASSGQAPAVQAWIAFWSSLISLNPLLFARLEASMETALAVFLILGLFSNLSYVAGLFLALGIWAIPEGFGGPYQPGQTTDIGTSLPYALLFGTLLVVSAGRSYTLDQWLTPRLGRLGFLAAGSLHKRELEVKEQPSIREKIMNFLVDQQPTRPLEQINIRERVMNFLVDQQPTRPLEQIRRDAK